MQTNVINVTQLQKLNQHRLARLISKLPPIEVVLEWDRDCGTDYGSYDNTEHEIEFGDYFVRCNLSVSETGKTKSATYESPQEYNRQSTTIDVSSVEAWYGEEDIVLSEAQKDALCEAIEDKITF